MVGLAMAGAAATIHDLLRDHCLPAGVLPRAVRSLSLDEETGLLEARLDAPCYARWRDNPVYFDRVVAGNLSYGALRGVVGLSQEELFLWLPVKGILVADPSSGVLLLDIGVARKQLSLSLFEEPPDCRPPGEFCLGCASFARSVEFPFNFCSVLQRRLMVVAEMHKSKPQDWTALEERDSETEPLSV